MSRVLETSVRKKFILSFWITSLFFVVASFCLISFFARGSSPDETMFYMAVWGLSLLLYFFIRDFGYVKRRTRYLFYSMGVQVVVLAFLFILFVKAILRWISVMESYNFFDVVLFSLLISISFYFFMNCYGLWKINCVDRKVRNEAIASVKVLRGNHINSASETSVRKGFLMGLFLMASICCYRIFLKAVYYSSGNLSRVAFLVIAFSFLFFFLYYFGYKKRGSKYLLCMIIASIVGFLFSLAFASVSYRDEQFYVTFSVLIETWMSYRVIGDLVLVYFVFSCIRLYRVNLQLKRAELVFIEEMVHSNKLK